MNEFHLAGADVGEGEGGGIDIIEEEATVADVGGLEAEFVVGCVAIDDEEDFVGEDNGAAFVHDDWADPQAGSLVDEGDVDFGACETGG